MKNKVNFKIIFLLNSLIIITLVSCKYNIRVPNNPPEYPKGYMANIKEWEIRELLIHKRYDELNLLLSSYQSTFENNFEKENQLDAAFNSFELPDPKLKSFFSEWIENFPEKFQPYLAVAYYYNSLAWQSRGYKYINETPRERVIEMLKYIDTAINYTNKAIELYPRLALGYKMLIELNIHGANKALIRKYLEKGLEICPEYFGIRVSYMYTLLPRWGGSYAEMESFVYESEKYWDQNPRIKLLGGYIYWDMGKVEAERDEYDKAMEYFNKAVEFGENTTFLYHRAKCFFYGLKDNESALYDINKCIAFQPYIMDYYLLRAKIYLQKNDIQLSINDYEQAERIKPNDVSLKSWKEYISQHYVVEGYKYVKSDLNKALQLMDNGEEYSQTNSELYYWRGFVYSKMGRYQESLNDLKKSIQINPQYFEAYRMIDWLLARENRWNEIIDYWNRYIYLVPNDAKAYFERSGTYYHNGNLNLAIEDLKKACSLGHKGACEKLKQFK